MKILVVESPAKSKTINKYLGKDFIVIPSFGHIRDLPSKNGSVKPDDNFSMVWNISKTGKKCISDISKNLKNVDELLLATDPDREGEAISWHILDCLKDDLVKKNVAVKRIVFHEITKKAINDALNNPRDIDQNLVDAYLARRALDYLFGFSLSPVLWRKLPGCKSAGRVQSVALRILTDREDEIDAFKTQEFWSIEAKCEKESQREFLAKLTVLNGEKLSKLSIKNDVEANLAKGEILNKKFTVLSVDKKDVKRNAYPPFITSTLQQDASRKLNFSAKKTMQIAQTLYEGIEIEGGRKALITYMRTDSVNLSKEFIEQSRAFIAKQYGDEFVPEKHNVYKSKVKNAQEAHEAIRPINVEITPSSLSGILDPDLLKLYDLIWKRAVASQMKNAIYNQVQIDISDSTRHTVLHVAGSTLAFDGYLKVYEEGKDIEDDETTGAQSLPTLNVGDAVHINDVLCNQHFTQPPPRYTEASLVKRMEELGIGRPSTYATIIQVLQDRKYATINKKAFIPESRGRIVVAFLMRYFPNYLQYDFTAGMEEDLDDISNHEKCKDAVLSSFWDAFSGCVKDIQKINMKDVIDSLNESMANVFFPENDGENSRQCPKCGTGKLMLKLWSTGAFLGCSNYPECDYKKNITSQDENSIDSGQPLSSFPKSLGDDIDTGKEVFVKSGPYGFYVELNDEKKKRVSIPKQIDPENVDLNLAMFLLSLPKKIGENDGEDISIGIGKYGPYLLYKKKYTSIKNFDDFINMNIEKAKVLLGL